MNNERDDNEEYYDTQVVESDSHLTEDEIKVYELLKEKKINAKAVKERSANEKKTVKTLYL